MEKTVVELFAGVGGFRVGLNNISEIDNEGHAVEHGNFNFVWANQWEPATKIQPAFDCYKLRFNDDDTKLSNMDITSVNKKSIPNHTLLCGGFPCQDYSVARSLTNEKGIEGKKGVLWWQIVEIIKAKRTPFILLENVDRLLKSPAKQRGRDFAIMLRCLYDLGYAVEWRVINAADYGHPQRRRRVFIFAYNKKTNYYKAISKSDSLDVILSKSLFAKCFPIDSTTIDIKQISLLDGFDDLFSISKKFKATFLNAGYMLDGVVYTGRVTPICANAITLGEILQDNVNEKYYLDENKLEKFRILRGSKKILRTAPDGSHYFYSEGSMSPYDATNLPSRTMLTSEGSINRSSHIVIDRQTNRIRILTPIECERLNQFPDNWTNTMSERRRYFVMGNALVCGLIKTIGNELSNIIDNEK